MIKKRVILLICIACVVVTSSILILLNTNKEDVIPNEVEVDTPVEDYEVSIMTVVDFVNNRESDRIEARYSVNESKTKLYRNGKYIGYSNMVAGEHIGLMIFAPEERMSEITFNSLDLEGYKTDITNTYSMSIETTEQYIATLLKSNNYELLRRVNSPTYCEAYLKDKEGSTIRIVVTSDTMIMAPLKSDVEIKEIIEYFDKSGGNDNEN